MKRIEAEDFVWPRVYFTAFAPSIVNRTQDTEVLNKVLNYGRY